MADTVDGSSTKVTPARVTAALRGRYVIERELGSGGMATVYVAEDLRHRRSVAVKVFRPELVGTIGPDRFLREIEVAARLTHPHIVPVHDSGNADGMLYYVMPLIDGESLRARLAREGSLSIPDALRILREVVDALALAHRNGIVHRDIKPDNILLASNHAMVADFGVAKALTAASDDRQTTLGMAVGTPAYMSPEQAAADPAIDQRSDIFAVGVLAYEMLTGQPPFRGGSPQAVLAAVLTQTPAPLQTLRASVPPALERVVLRCLERNPADRWASANALLAELERLSTISGAIAAGTMPAPSTRRSPARIMSLVGVSLAVVAAWALWTKRGNTTYQLANIRQLTRDPGVEFDPTISPDGREVAYVASGDDISGAVHLYVTDVRGGRAIPLTAEREGDQSSPRWLPDGRTIAFYDERDGWLAVPRFGGPAIVSGQQRFSAFGFRRFGADSLLPLPADAHDIAHSSDGRLVAFVTGNWFYDEPGNLANIAPSRLFVRRLDGGSIQEIAGGPSLNTAPVWMPDSRSLLFVSDRGGKRDVYVARVDDDGRLRGTLDRLSTGLSPHTLSVSADGTLLTYSQLIFRSNVWAIDVPPTGVVSLSAARPVTTGNQVIEGHDVSRDGQWVVYDTDVNGSQDLYIRRLGEREARRLTTDAGYDSHPSFSPDGRQVVFHSFRYGTRDLFVIDADGSHEQRITTDRTEEYNAQFSPDGLAIAFRIAGKGLAVITRERIGAPWSAPRLIASKDVNAVWLPDSRHVTLQAAMDTVLVVAMDGTRTFTRTAAQIGLRRVFRAIAEPGGRELLVNGEAPDRTQGLYRVPLDGGPVSLAVKLDDPRRKLQYTLSKHGRTVYLSLSERESDIYLADILRR